MAPGIDEAAIAAIARTLAGAESALFITGAGLSHDSGLPTYRGIGGLYEEQDTQDGIPIEEALSGPMFRTRPELVWKYIDQIARGFLGARPNRGHQVIAELEQRMGRVWTLTQNVDAFHTAAGSKNVIEIHGDVHRLHCTMCPHRQYVDDWARLDVPPDCPQCAAILRPEVVLFGEMLPEDPVQCLHRELDRGFDVVISVGTSSLFPYIAEPVFMAQRAGQATVEINPSTTVISEAVTHKLNGRAAPVLGAILEAYLKLVGG